MNGQQLKKKVDPVKKFNPVPDSDSEDFLADPAPGEADDVHSLASHLSLDAVENELQEENKKPPTLPPAPVPAAPQHPTPEPMPELQNKQLEHKKSQPAIDLNSVT